MDVKNTAERSLLGIMAIELEFGFGLELKCLFCQIRLFVAATANEFELQPDELELLKWNRTIWPGRLLRVASHFRGARPINCTKGAASVQPKPS